LVSAWSPHPKRDTLRPMSSELLPWLCLGGTGGDQLWRRAFLHTYAAGVLAPFCPLTVASVW
jgi:hypothetical protein